MSAAVSELGEYAPHLTTTSEVAEGGPAKGIIDAAQRWKADLIVIGSKGHGAVASFLLGSVTLNVVLHAPCSVQVARTTNYNADDRDASASQPGGG